MSSHSRFYTSFHTRPASMEWCSKPTPSPPTAAHLPPARNATLNPIRVPAVLPGLAPPVAGTQSLAGDNVQLSDVEAPAIAAPTEPTGTDFNFNARTDNFAAVNAYYLSDKFFRLLDGMGFTRAGYFGSTTFPTPVDHRGLKTTTPRPMYIALLGTVSTHIAWGMPAKLEYYKRRMRLPIRVTW